MTALAPGLSPFVGRERELGALQAAMEAAEQGTGSMALLTGEPGIGKTRTAHEFGEWARDRGAAILWGACYEGQVSPSYGPWGEALGKHVRSLTRTQLRRRLGSNGSVLAEILTDVQKALPDLPPPPQLGPEESRLRAYDALSDYLLHLASKPVVLVLDDLHWADSATLGLLEYVARFLSESRLFIVGTYRDAELDLIHPLNQCVAELDRLGVCHRLPLGLLGPEDVRTLVERLYGGPVPNELVESILRETEGNPFFVSEVVRHLRDEGVDHAGDSLAPRAVPETVRQAIGRRIARLSPEASRMLALASAFHGPFDFAVLQALTGLAEGGLLKALDEALAARMIRPTDDRGEKYEFAHAIVRHTLYDELGPSRRARLHRRIAQALERVHAGHELEYAAELARQYELSASVPGAAHGIRWALAAADQAAGRHAYEQAVAFLRIASELASESDVTVRADIQCRLSLALADALMVEEAQLAVDTALSYLELLQVDRSLIGEFLGEAVWRLRDAGAVMTDLEAIVGRGLASVADRHDLNWARLEVAIPSAEPIRAGPINAGRFRQFDPEASRIVRTEGSELDYARSVEVIEWRTRQQVEDLLHLGEQFAHPLAKARVMSVVIRNFQLRHADAKASIDVCLRLLELAKEIGSIAWQAFALSYLADAEAALGEFGSAVKHEQRAYELIGRLGRGHGLQQAVHSFRRAEEPDWEAVAELHWHRACDPSVPGRNGLWHAAVAAYAHARTGREVEAREVIGFIVPAVRQLEPNHYQVDAIVGWAAAAAWELGATDLAPGLLEAAERIAEAGVGGNLLQPVELTVARMSGLAERWEEAWRWFDQARTALEERGQRPLRAVVDFDEALARRRGRLPGSAPLLRSARIAFEELGMTGWVRRVDELAKAGRDVFPAGLTLREVEVLRRVAVGRKNREIADELCLSVHTVDRHLANAFVKIGAHNRAGAVAFALRHDL